MDFAFFPFGMGCVRTCWSCLAVLVNCDGSHLLLMLVLCQSILVPSLCPAMAKALGTFNFPQNMANARSCVERFNIHLTQKTGQAKKDQSHLSRAAASSCLNSPECLREFPGYVCPVIFNLVHLTH